MHLGQHHHQLTVTHHHYHYTIFRMRRALAAPGPTATCNSLTTLGSLVRAPSRARRGRQTRSVGTPSTKTSSSLILAPAVAKDAKGREPTKSRKLSSPAALTYHRSRYTHVHLHALHTLCMQSYATNDNNYKLWSSFVNFNCNNYIESCQVVMTSLVITPY